MVTVLTQYLTEYLNVVNDKKIINHLLPARQNSKFLVKLALNSLYQFGGKLTF